MLLEAYAVLSETWRFVVNLIAIGLITFIFAGLLSPLEALGWWAGWYGDRVDTTLDPGTLVEPNLPKTKIVRYVIYLDGINQTKFQCLPEVDIFLNELANVLPDDILIIKGLMSYSVINRPLTEGRIFSFLWRLGDRLQISKSGGILGALIGLTILLRNLTVVAVSADKRYGPIYNQGTAQVICHSLISHGYQLNSQVALTLIGYSGGGQIAMGAATHLKRSLTTSVDVISISGVISGNNNALKLEHLHHFVGDKDLVERLGPILFPRRWQIFFFSYWNWAKRQGKITITSLGPVGHNSAGGPLDANKFLPDGRSYLRQTIDLVAGVIQGSPPIVSTTTKRKTSNYELYQQAAFNQFNYYPLNQTVDSNYRPIATWMGRLILPNLEERRQIQGVLFEVHHTDLDHQHLIGQIVKLRWSNDPQVQANVRAVTKDLHFSEEAEYSQSQGKIHPERLNHWQQVDPLESLAGARPNDDVIVMLRSPLVEDASSEDQCPTLFISSEPVQITGRFYGLVTIVSPLEAASDQFRVVHFNRTSHQFDSVEEIVVFPEVIANLDGILPSTTQDIEKSPLNSTGWYIYGAKDHNGMFVVQAIAPRALLRLEPERVIFGEHAALNYLTKELWKDTVVQKGQNSSVLLAPNETSGSARWQEGNRALLLHVYGGIGGKKREPAAKTPIFFGHFAYGVARVVREPLAGELQFEIEYCQVYSHNVDGIIAGTIAWNRYLGDRQFGWLGTRPVSDILIKLDAFTGYYEFKGVQRSPLDILFEQLEAMMARYRIGDGTGGTYVGPAHNCAQDSNQALYGTIKRLQVVTSDPKLQDELARSQAQSLAQLMKLGKSIREDLLPLGTARADWENNSDNLGISPEEDAIQSLLMGLASWRTMLPRMTSETITKLFLQQGASVWVLHTNQVGGYDSNIEPIAPTKIGL